MRKLSVVLLSLLFILCAMLGISACNSSGDGKELPSSDIYKKVNPSVAMVSINKLQGSTSGTGFFIDNNGTLVTNYNVIKDGVSGKIQLHNGTTADIGNVLGYDETLNIAVLETKATNTTPVAISQANSVEVGDTVYAIGYPSSTESKASSSVFSTGMVSSFLSDGTLEYIQSNIEITDGNSGGVLINSAGKVIGITTAKVNVNGSNYMNLSIPIEEVNNVVLNVNESLEIVTKRHYPVYVNFYVDGDLYDSQKLQYEQVATSISPDKLGYTFDGWYIDENFTAPYDFSQKVLKTFNLYAKFNINSYKVTYNLNSGSWTDSVPDDKWTIDNCDSDLPIPSRAGYLFEGWTDNNGNFVDTFPSSSNLSDIAYDAHWIEGAEGLTFNNGVVTSYCGTATSITIPKSFRGISITRIADSVFRGCNSLEKVSLSDKISEIGDFAFNNCSKLSEINFPESIVSIGNSVFTGCANLKTISAPAIVAGKISKQADAKETYITAGTFIPDAAFRDCINLEYVFLPESLTIIGENAFSGCHSLTNIEIPNSVIKIGFSALNGCTGLTSVTLPFVGKSSNNSEESFLGYIFGAEESQYNNDYVPISLKEVTITGGINISDYAFRRCSGLKNIYLSKSIQNIGNGAFSGCSGLINMEIPNSVINIGNSVFVGCSGLTSMTIPDSVTSIGEGIFNGCTELVYVSISKNVTNIANRTFYGCSSLVEVAIHGNIKNIGQYAFYGCIHLAGLVIPNSVVSIGMSAFENCNGLKKIVIPSSVTNISLSAFKNCIGLEEVHVSDLAAWCTIDFATLDTNPLSYAHSFYLNGELIKDLIIPNGVENIGNFAFGGCNELISVVFPDSVKNIGSSAFYGCSGLTNVVIPDSVTNIGDSAFRDCGGLTNVVISDNVKNIGSLAFYNCSGLLSIELPDGLTTISNSMFAHCSKLTSVVIGNNVTSISWYVFYECSKLTSIFYKGTSEEWNSIFISGHNDELYFANRYYYIENEANVPNDGGNYWHYDIDGKTPVIWNKGKSREKNRYWI